MGGRGAIVIVDKRFHNLLVKNFTFSIENHFEFLSPRVRYYLRVRYICNIKYFVFIVGIFVIYIYITLA